MSVSFYVFIALLPWQEAGNRAAQDRDSSRQHHHLRGLGIQKRSIVLLFPLSLLRCTNGWGTSHHTIHAWDWDWDWGLREAEWWGRLGQAGASWDRLRLGFPKCQEWTDPSTSVEGLRGALPVWAFHTMRQDPLPCMRAT